MRLHRGVHPQLEAEADAILAQELRKVTSHQAKSDILTPWKAAARRSREVYVSSGTPDPASRSGIFGRALNPTRPYLNSSTPASLRQHRQFQATQGYSRESVVPRSQAQEATPEGLPSWDEE